MRTTFSIKSILAVSLVLIMSSTAAAIISGGSVTFKNCLIPCSIEVEGLLKGLGNVTKTPTAFTATVALVSGTVFCKNPANNSVEANGQPFKDIPVTVDAAANINPAQVSRNGKALSDIIIHDSEMIAALAQAGFSVTCQNANWVKAIVVTDMEVLGQQVSDPDPANTTCFLTPAENQDFIIDSSCHIDDSLRNHCTLPEPYFTTPKLALGKQVKEIDYQCSQICHSTDSTQCNLDTP